MQVDLALDVTPRRLPRIAVVLVAVALSLVLVVAPGPRADAFVNPAPILIGGALDAAPAEGAVIGGACATGVGCLAVGAVGLGLLAWATHDSWMPVVSGWFNDEPSMTPRADGSFGCPVTAGDVQGSVASVIVHGHADGSCFPYYDYPRIHVEMKNMRCVNLATGEVSAAIYGHASGASIVGPARGSVPIDGDVSVSWDPNSGSYCGPGMQVISYLVQVVSGKSSSGGSPYIKVDLPMPDNAWRTDSEVDCKRPDGTTFHLTGSDVGYPDRIAVPSCRQVDPDSVPTDLQVTDPYGNDIVTAGFPDWVTEMPDCFGPSGLLCQIQVYVHGLPCTPGMAGCIHFWSHRLDPDADLDCRFGPYSVPWPNCEPLKRSYIPDAQPQPQTDPNWPPAPDPNEFPDPDPTASPSTDPSTDPSTSPTPDPTPTPTPTDDPCIGGTDDTGAVICGPNPSPPGDPNGGSCVGAAWSWNPVKWVYIPVKCALSWAFIPQEGLQTRVIRLKNEFSTRVPFAWFAPLGTMPYAIGGGCPDWVVHVNGYDKNVVCDSSYTQAIRGARPWLTGAMLTLAFWPLIRSLMYAGVPLLKPTPTEPVK